MTNKSITYSLNFDIIFVQLRIIVCYVVCFLLSFLLHLLLLDYRVYYSTSCHFLRHVKSFRFQYCS